MEDSRPGNPSTLSYQPQPKHTGFDYRFTKKVESQSLTKQGAPPPFDGQLELNPMCNQNDELILIEPRRIVSGWGS